MRLGRRLVVGSFRVLLRLLAHVEVRGGENLPAGGPLMVVFNHVHHIDAPLLMATLPWEVEALGRAESLKVPITAELMRLYGVIALSQDQLDRQGLRRALEVLARGGVLLCSPEGRESPSGGLVEAQAGVAYLALKSGAPILPVGLIGSESFVPALRRLRRARLTVNVGAVFRPDGRLAHGVQRRAQLAAGSQQMMRHIAELLPQRYRGIYG